MTSAGAPKVPRPVDEVLFLCPLAFLAGAETITDVVRFGDETLASLRRIRSFVYGTWIHGRPGDILASLDAAALRHCFVAWVAAPTGASADVVGTM